MNMFDGARFDTFREGRARGSGSMRQKSTNRTPFVFGKTPSTRYAAISGRIALPRRSRRPGGAAWPCEDRLETYPRRLRDKNEARIKQDTQRSQTRQDHVAVVAEAHRRYQMARCVM